MREATDQETREEEFKKLRAEVLEFLEFINHAPIDEIGILFLKRAKVALGYDTELCEAIEKRLRECEG